MSGRPDPAIPDDDSRPWYAGITRYQWLVLVIASLGWVFDVFEGQIFVASMNEAMPSLLPEDVRQLEPAERRRHEAFYNNITFGAFLLGGALGGILFGMMSDRIGRKRTMMYTILMYSLFTCFSAFSQAWWHMAWFRFLVAMGVGGEWAVASTLVAEVFPKRARAWSLGIFHASSVLGTYLAILAGVFIVGNPALGEWVHRTLGLPGETMDPSLPWRLGFLVGVLPALLIIWIRRSLREPDEWQHARTTALEDLSKKLGSFGELFAPGLRRNTLVGFGLAAVGMATFWGAHIYGKDLMRRDVEPYFVPVAEPPQTRSALGRLFAGWNLREPAPLPDAGERAAHLEPLIEQTAAEFRARLAETDRPDDPAAAEPLDEIAAATLQVLLEHDLRGLQLEVAAVGLTRYEVQARRVAASAPGADGTPVPPEPAVFFVADNRVTANHCLTFIAAAQNRLAQRIKRWEMFGMFLVTTGGGLGLVLFGPVSEAVGRRRAFLFYQLGGVIMAGLAFQLLAGWQVWLVALPVFGFLTLGMHAGYAIYFPELFPTRLRGTGAGFCFNVGRVLAAPILFVGGWMQRDWGFSLEDTGAILSLLFLIGALLLIFAPETRGRDLPE